MWNLNSWVFIAVLLSQLTPVILEVSDLELTQESNLRWPQFCADLFFSTAAAPWPFVGCYDNPSPSGLPVKP